MIYSKFVDKIKNNFFEIPEIISAEILVTCESISIFWEIKLSLCDNFSDRSLLELFSAIILSCLAYDCSKLFWYNSSFIALMSISTSFFLRIILWRRIIRFQRIVNIFLYDSGNFSVLLSSLSAILLRCEDTASLIISSTTWSLAQHQ